MDNNMIHIDDLVRQRLRGGEEPDRPGAWLSMRELLDKEMPVQAGYNWRRIIGYFTALLLLTTASVGGYRMYSNHMAGTGIASGGGGRDGEGAYGAPSGVGNGSGVKGVNSSATNTGTSSKPNTQASLSPTAVSAVASNASTSPSAVTIPAGNQSQSGSNGPASSGNDASMEHSVAGTIKASSHHKPSSITASAQHQSPSENTATTAPVNNPLYASAAGTTVGAHRVQRAPEKLNAAAMPALQLQASASGVQASAVAVPHPAPVTVSHDTIERMEIVYRRVYDADANRHYYRIDTFPVGKIVVDRVMAEPQSLAITETTAKPKHHNLFGHKQSSGKTDASAIAANNATEPAAVSNKMEIASAATAPNAAAIEPKTAEQQVGLVAANAAIAAAKTSRFAHWAAEIADAADRAKTSVSRIEMYPGVMGGINASLFTPNALGGFQLGLTSLFVLNDWWSLMLEPKYILRYNTGSSVRDDYKEVIDNSGKVVPDPQFPGYLYYTWTDKTIQHSFNYDMVNTFELPVMLRYHAGPWYFQGGANLVYSASIKAKETTTALSDYKTHGESRPSLVQEPFITNDHPNMLISDFGSRFGTGYVISGGYMFSPAVYVDVRLAQTFWDNSKTTGAKQVSRDLLRTPSIQISAGYRFNSNKK